jgi:hypothetical protein
MIESNRSQNIGESKNSRSFKLLIVIVGVFFNSSANALCLGLFEDKSACEAREQAEEEYEKFSEVCGSKARYDCKRLLDNDIEYMRCFDYTYCSCLEKNGYGQFCSIYY